jgi:hypothetical protein
MKTLSNLLIFYFIVIPLVVPFLLLLIAIPLEIIGRIKYPKKD